MGLRRLQILGLAGSAGMQYGIAAMFIIATPLPASSNTVTFSGPARIIDGDTLEVAGKPIRLHGIDAPESDQTCLNSAHILWSCGRVATESLRHLASIHPIKCHSESRGRYGRHIAVCHINSLNLNQWMVREGWAVAYRRYSKDYIPDETKARRERLGIWSGQFIEPWRWRRRERLSHLHSNGGKP